MHIELLWFEGCPNHHAAEQVLREVMSESGVDDEVVRVEVPDLETGERTKFPGSPTIRIDGVDVDPTFKDTGDYTPRCRVYLTDDGFKGTPQRAWIEAAVKKAVAAT